jgi:hypothetical protein
MINFLEVERFSPKKLSRNRYRNSDGQKANFQNVIEAQSEYYRFSNRQPLASPRLKAGSSADGKNPIHCVCYGKIISFQAKLKSIFVDQNSNFKVQISSTNFLIRNHTNMQVSCMRFHHQFFSFYT